MIRRLLAPLAAATFALTLPGAASAQAPATSMAGTTELATRFDPPLDKPLRYRLIQERSRDGSIGRSTVEQEVTYSRSGSGYVMTLRQLRITVGATSIDLTDPKAPLPPTMKLLMAAVAFDLDSDGAIVRVREWEAFKRNLRALIPELASSTESDPAKRPGTEALMRNFLEPFLAASAEDAPSLVAKGWPDVLGLMGLSAREGEVIAAKTPVSSPMLPDPLTYQVSVKLTAPPGTGALHIEVTSVPDPADFKKAVLSLVDRMMQSLPPGKRSRADVERELGNLDITMQMSVDLDAQSGLLRRAVVTKNANIGSKAGFDRITIEAM
jgi:hypothetical protein